MCVKFPVFCPEYLEWWLDSTLHLVLFIQYILNTIYNYMYYLSDGYSNIHVIMY